MKYTFEFTTTKLKNGITVYGKKTTDPFVIASIHIPVGHIHNTGSIVPGSMHLLEHMVCNRSRLYPGHGEFDKYVSLHGGSTNGTTTVCMTYFEFGITSKSFPAAFKGMLSQVFEPIFATKDLRNEIAIIGNERSKSKWYPTDNKYQHHKTMKWKYQDLTGKRQDIGNDSDLASITVPYLKRLHNLYFDSRSYVIVGGNYDHDFVCAELSKIKTEEHDLAKKFTPHEWRHRKYHTARFSDIDKYVYHMGGIVDSTDYEEIIAVAFIGQLLTNTVHGALYKWLRHKLGWCYSMSFDFSIGGPYYPADWEMSIPLGTLAKANRVRRELHDRIQRALADRELLAKEHTRRMSEMVFDHQTLASVMNEARDSLFAYGRIVSEEEYIACLNRCKNPSYLKGIYEKYWSPEVVGEFTAIPIK